MVDLVRRSHLVDVALVEDDDAVGQGERLALVVRDVHESGAGLPVDAAQFHLHLEPDLEIERRERLVQEQHARAIDEGAREGDALHLATGQLVGPPLAVALESHQHERLGHALGALGSLDSGHTQPERHVVSHVEVREQCGALEDHVERAAMGRDPRDVGVAEQHATGRRPLEAGNDAQQGRLATA